MRPTLGMVFLFVVAMLLAAAGGEDIQTTQLVFEGSHTFDDAAGLLVVGGGDVAVPAGTVHDGSLYVLGGDVSVAGRVDGNVVLLSGTLSLADTATVAGNLDTYGPGVDDAGATVDGRRRDPVVAQQARQRSGFGWVGGTLGLAAVAYLLERRRPALLGNVGAAVEHHPVVSGTVGTLVAAMALALIVLMAFTVVLVPLSIFAAGVGLLVTTYGSLAFGRLVGERLPLDRRPLATAAGVVVYAGLIALLGRVPAVGSLTVLSLTLVGIGAVLVTYFGVVPFEPPSLATD